MDTIITATLVPEEHRQDLTTKLFGIHYPLYLEPTIFLFADRLSSEYHGGYWQFYTLSNGGFYMAPENDSFPVFSENGWRGSMSADAYGVTTCLFAFSHLSFSQREDLAQLCARHFHLLREFAMDQGEVKAILAAID
jgi:hypothetical protein